MSRIQHTVPEVQRQRVSLTPQQEKRLKKACQEFESVLLSYMFKNMRETVSKSGLFESSGETPESIFRGMFDRELAKEISSRNNLGLAEMMFKQLTGKA